MNSNFVLIHLSDMVVFILSVCCFIVVILDVVWFVAAVCLLMCLSVHHSTAWCLWRPEENIKPLDWNYKSVVSHQVDAGN